MFPPFVGALSLGLTNWGICTHGYGIWLVHTNLANKLLFHDFGIADMKAPTMVRLVL